MLFESRHIRVTADHGIATLAFGFGGEPTNALDLARLRELDASLLSVASCPYATILVVRSSNPFGFCAGLRHQALSSLTDPSDRAAFAWYGQQVFDRLARLDAVSLAVIDGPCLDSGLELALACDFRLCVARSTTHIGFPGRIACFGGTTRLRQLLGRHGNELLTTGRTLSGREAQQQGLVDVACCERRAKIEMRSMLDRLESNPAKPRRPADADGLAAERRAFASAQSKPTAKTSVAPANLNPIPPCPEVIGLLGNDPNAERLAAEVALRGGSVVVCGDRSGVFAGIAIAQRRGFVTPLEAEDAWRRVRTSDYLDGFERAGLVFVAEGHNPFRLAASIRPRTVVGVVRPAGSEPFTLNSKLTAPFPHPRRLIGINFTVSHRVALFPDSATDADTVATLSAWLKPFNLSAIVFPVAARLLPRAA